MSLTASIEQISWTFCALSHKLSWLLALLRLCCYLKVARIHSELEGMQLTEGAQTTGQVVDVFDASCDACHDDCTMFLHLGVANIQIGPPVGEVGLGLRVGHQHPEGWKQKQGEKKLKRTSAWSTCPYIDFFKGCVTIIIRCMNTTWILPAQSFSANLGSLGLNFAPQGLHTGLVCVRETHICLGVSTERENGSRDATQVDSSKRLYIKPDCTTPVNRIQTTPPIKKLPELFPAGLI